jgi:hypothetical protein
VIPRVKLVQVLAQRYPHEQPHITPCPLLAAVRVRGICLACWPVSAISRSACCVCFRAPTSRLRCGTWRRRRTRSSRCSVCSPQAPSANPPRRDRRVTPRRGMSWPAHAVRGHGPTSHAPSTPSRTDTASRISTAEGHPPVPDTTVDDFDGTVRDVEASLSLPYIFRYNIPKSNQEVKSWAIPYGLNGSCLNSSLA